MKTSDMPDTVKGKRREAEALQRAADRMWGDAYDLRDAADAQEAGEGR